MSVTRIQEEYDLSLDDIRWYLSTLVTESLLSQRESPEEITHRIWSGALESQLYDMEERFIRDLQDELDRGLIDEQKVREHFERARALAFRRRSQS
ncbi:MAG: hypothetical protein ACOCU9_03720 [Spirochaetota bacterium]